MRGCSGVGRREVGGPTLIVRNIITVKHTLRQGIVGLSWYMSDRIPPLHNDLSLPNCAPDTTKTARVG